MSTEHRPSTDPGAAPVDVIARPREAIETRREAMDPQPPIGIKYLLGRESWMDVADQTPLRLHCEEWGNLGPLELDPDIRPNAAGFRVRGTDFPAPAWARGFYQDAGVYFWTDAKVHGERPAAPQQ